MCTFHGFWWTSLWNRAALPKNHWHLNPCDYTTKCNENPKNHLECIIYKSLLLYTSVLTPYQSREDNEEAYSAFLGKDMVSACVYWTVRATAVFSCGRCASLCAWWLGQWSWSGRPELHPAVPARSLPLGQGSSAASASANTHTIQY